MNVSEVRKHFPALNRIIDGRPVLFADNASTTLKSVNTIGAVARYYMEVCANVHRGANAISREAEGLYEGARAKVARFINAQPEELKGLGPVSLCPENARKSHPSALTSSFMCGADWAASTSVRIPLCLAIWMISATGLMRPVTLEMWPSATSRVLELVRPSTEAGLIRPSLSSPARRSRAFPVHGRILE